MKCVKEGHTFNKFGSPLTITPYFYWMGRTRCVGIYCMGFRAEYAQQKSRDSCIAVYNPSFYIYRLHLENRGSNNRLRIGLSSTDWGKKYFLIYIYSFCFSNAEWIELERIELSLQWWKSIIQSNRMSVCIYIS